MGSGLPAMRAWSTRSAKSGNRRKRRAFPAAGHQRLDHKPVRDLDRHRHILRIRHAGHQPVHHRAQTVGVVSEGPLNRAGWSNQTDLMLKTRPINADEDRRLFLYYHLSAGDIEPTGCFAMPCMGAQSH
jgi:hypothetical protein